MEQDPGDTMRKASRPQAEGGWSPGEEGGTPGFLIILPPDTSGISMGTRGGALPLVLTCLLHINLPIYEAPTVCLALGMQQLTRYRPQLPVWEGKGGKCKQTTTFLRDEMTYVSITGGVADT